MLQGSQAWVGKLFNYENTLFAMFGMITGRKF